MANPFEELEKGVKPKEDKPVVAPPPSINMFRDIEAPRSITPTPAPAPEDRSYQPTMFDKLTSKVAGGFTLGLTDLVTKLTNPKRAEQDAQFAKEHPYLSMGAEVAGGIGPGIASGLLVGKAIPALSKATLPAIIGNAGVSGAAMSPIEDIIRGKTDPIEMATRSLTSGATGALGAGVLSGALRVLPGNKFRAAGSDLTPVDKASMKDLAATGDRAGIPLRIPELAAERAPGRAAGVEGLDNFMGRMKSGEIEKSNFDAGRLPNLKRAVDTVKRIVGPVEETGLGAQTGAKMAIKNAEDIVRNSARPDYKAAEGVVLPHRQSEPNILETRKGLYKDKVIEPSIRNADPNSIGVLQHTADALEGQIKNNRGGPAREGMLISQKRGLLNEMEAASPEFARAQATTSAGKEMVEEIKAGPLGVMAATTKPSTQARALLDAEPNAGRKAVGRLSAIDPELPPSILANEVNALSKDPVTFGRKLAPTTDSEKVINEIVGDQDFAAIKDIITAARARTKAPKPGGGENSDGPVGGVWDALQNLSSGGVVRRMNDPANIDKLGEQGALQRLLNAFGLSLEDAAIDNLFKETPPKPKKNKSDVRSASAR